MIHNEKQYKLTKTWLRKFRKALKEAPSALFKHAYESQIEELEGQVREYEQLQKDFQRKHQKEQGSLKLPAGLVLTPKQIQDLKAMPRQRRYQQLRILQGLCAGCGKEPLASARLGKDCLSRQRERMRQKTGAKKRYTTAYTDEAGR